jgi:hypothetical protein
VQPEKTARPLKNGRGGASPLGYPRRVATGGLPVAAWRPSVPLRPQPPPPPPDPGVGVRIYCAPTPSRGSLLPLRLLSFFSVELLQWTSLTASVASVLMPPRSGTGSPFPGVPQAVWAPRQTMGRELLGSDPASIGHSSVLLLLLVGSPDCASTPPVRLYCYPMSSRGGHWDG